MDKAISALDHAVWMRRCLELAVLGRNRVAPNPMVGAVLVQKGNVLAEGWHQLVGGPHAEVNCLNAFGEGPVPEDAILYVNLEPCSHHGRTPPCAEMLIRREVRTVVVGQWDPFPAVSGRGIALLQEAGIKVTVGVEEDACTWLQRRFLTSVKAARPYVILKWARSRDGFLDQHPRTERSVQRISSAGTDVLVHAWRSAEQAILVGSRTVLNDDPSLTVRHVDGRQPLRIVIDRKGITPASSKMFTSGDQTLLLTDQKRNNIAADQHILSPGVDPIEQLFRLANERSIRSILVEGGAELLGHFLQSGRWDEAREITSEAIFHRGTSAPTLDHLAAVSLNSGTDHIALYINAEAPIAGSIGIDPAWPW